MSSNMYGFTCDLYHQNARYFVQIVYVGTRDDDEETRDRVTEQWETIDPAHLAKYELEHRDWSARFHGEKRLMVWGVYGVAENTSPAPTDRDILELIASGKAINLQHGWDT